MSRRARGSIDRELGIETSRKERFRVRPGDGPAHAQARDYQPTPPEVFEAMMSACSVEPEGASFVDLGAGKGRVLCLAAGWPFARVIGVELHPGWAEIARRNLGRLRSSHVRAAALEVRTEDAGSFLFPAGPKVVFLFNPFGPRVLARALARLAASPGPVALLYYEPVHAERVDAQPGFERVAETKLWTAWSRLG